MAKEVPDGERRLGARPDGHLVARLPFDDGDVSLQRDVLNRRVGVVALDDPVRLGETGLESPLRIRVILGMFVPGCGLKAALTYS